MERAGELVGYARVSMAATISRKPQHVDNQELRLTVAGCTKIFTDDGKSGKSASRPDWDKCMAYLREGDTLVVTKLDRIGRSLVNLVDVINVLRDRGVAVRCLDQGEIDTTTANGKLIFAIMAALAEWEATMTRERTVEGLAAARARYGGKLPVRKPSITADQLSTARALASQGDMSAIRIADVIGVSRATLYRHVPIAELRDAARAS